MSLDSNQISVIPLPLKIEHRPGVFHLTSDTSIGSDADNQWNAEFLQNLLFSTQTNDLATKLKDSSKKNHIFLSLNDSLGLGAEGYSLSIAENEIRIEAATTAGVFYGIQTLRQLLPAKIENTSSFEDCEHDLPCIEIKDSPRFKWRGFMLDESRHFHGKANIVRTLELMALQKLNILHWHLTDDQGWRIEIKQYPLLTEVGSKRKATMQGWIGKDDGEPHGGFYTQVEIKEIVDYAAKLNITIIPEIEMPGHARAALAAYPKLSCTGGPFEVATGFGIKKDIYCAGKEEVFVFLQNILNEVMELFPSEFIHLGGDEALKARWKKCPDCQRRIKEEGLKNTEELQLYFINRMAKYLDGHGRRAVGWNEILRDSLVESAVVHYWIKNKKAVVQAIKQGRDVVMSRYWYSYLDHSYSFTSLSNAYNYEPVFKELGNADEKHVLGLIAPLWTEWVPNQARLDYQTYPRLTAFAETGWTLPKRKNFESFKLRLKPFLARLDALGVNYAPLEDTEPSKLAQLFGRFTIFNVQKKTAK